MIQCPEAHLFCKACMTAWASTLLGEHNCAIVCVEPGGCKAAFTERELRRFVRAPSPLAPPLPPLLFAPP
jgi:E3 ubiquitin-protein ligase RNF216